MQIDYHRVYRTVTSESKLLDDQDLENISIEENPALATITVTDVKVPELTEEEQRDRLHFERKVEKAIFEAGKALMELRDGLMPRRRQSQALLFHPQHF
jgi:hypothetical protein